MISLIDQALYKFTGKNSKLRHKKQQKIIVDQDLYKHTEDLYYF